jgi:hypothetical protein
MSSNWRNIYTQLTDFIAQNTQIKIEQSSIEIPEDRRTEFYRLFDLTRSTFVEEEYSEGLEKAKNMSQHYLQAERELLGNAFLLKISLHPNMRWFVDNPVDGLKRVLYDSLFDLLKNKIGLEQFAALGRTNIRILDKALKSQCYQHWVLLELTCLLRVNKFYTVELTTGVSSVQTVETVQALKNPIREPKEIHEIALAHPPCSIFIIPDILAYSGRLDRFISIRAEPGMATWGATNASENLEWRPLDKNALLTPGLVIINTSDKLNDLALVRDSEAITRPDLAIVCRQEETWYEADWAEEIRFTRNLLKARLGTHIVSRPSVPAEVTGRLDFQEVLDKLSEGKTEENGNSVCMHSVGFDGNSLEPFIGMLSSLRQPV